MTGDGMSFSDAQPMIEEVRARAVCHFDLRRDDGMRH